MHRQHFLFCCIISPAKRFCTAWPAGTWSCVRLFSRKYGLTSNLVAENWATIDGSISRAKRVSRNGELATTKLGVCT